MNPPCDIKQHTTNMMLSHNYSRSYIPEIREEERRIHYHVLNPTFGNEEKILAAWVVGFRGLGNTKISRSDHVWILVLSTVSR